MHRLAREQALAQQLEQIEQAATLYRREGGRGTARKCLPLLALTGLTLRRGCAADFPGFDGRRQQAWQLRSEQVAAGGPESQWQTEEAGETDRLDARVLSLQGAAHHF